MKKILVLLFIILLIIGCKKKEGLELEIVNKSIVSIKSNGNDICNNMFDKLILKKSKTIIVYKLTNNDNKTYYFNQDFFGSKLCNRIKGLSINKAFIYFLDKEGHDVKFNYGHFSKDSLYLNNSFERNNKISAFLNYKIDGQEKFILDNYNFVIHPKETLYFEWFLNLPYGNVIQNANVEFDSTKEYYAETLIFSDSINYKKKLSRTVLQTIEENGYKVYHGIIKSKNKVPIKFVE